jgi:hypothetical protein
MKLLAKTAEERYQSALGLRADLEHCARQWARHGAIAAFPLGQQDRSDRFVVPQRLYGREQQLGALLHAFEQTCQGRSACMLVAGYAGIGKTTLIQELYKPLVRQRGYFIAGKCDQLARDIPYRALIQAFQQLVQRLLAEGEERLHVWRAPLAMALGLNGGVLAEVLPEIALILGPQPPVPPLGFTEAQHRFIMVVQNFLAVLAGSDSQVMLTGRCHCATRRKYRAVRCGMPEKALHGTHYRPLTVVSSTTGAGFRRAAIVKQVASAIVMSWVRCSGDSSLSSESSV